MRTIDEALRLIRFTLHWLHDSEIIRRNARWLLRPTTLVCLTALCFGLGGCTPLTNSTQEPPALTISHGGMTMDGPDTAYTVEIYANGLVHYHGELEVYVIGDRQAKITPEQVQQLIVTYRKTEQLLKKMDVIDKKRGTHSMPRHSPMLFRLQYQDEVSEIRPAGFAGYLFTKLEAMTPLDSWLCFPEVDPRSKEIGGCSGERLRLTPMDEMNKKLDNELILLNK